MDIWVLIPVKSLLDSKRRLSHLLPPKQRADLICDLLQRQLGILKQVRAVHQVLVISSDPTVWEIARQHGALVVEEQVSRGLNIAVTQGMAVAATNGASAVLILPVDLPYIAVSDVELLINRAAERSAANEPLTRGLQSPQVNAVDHPLGLVVIASDEAGDGTNALFVSPAVEFSFHFGPGSFHKHIEEAEKRDKIIEVITTPGLRFDIDNEGDWYTYQASKVGC